jgi:lysophospholipase L1-like esterase
MALTKTGLDALSGHQAGYPAYAATVFSKLNELANAMAIDKVTLSTIAANQGNPASDITLMKVLSDKLVDAINAAGGGLAYVAKLHAIGDSQTEAYYTNSWFSYYLKPLLNSTQFPPAEYNNIAKSGERSDQQLARLSSEVIARKEAGTGIITQDIAFVLVGVNDADTRTVTQTVHDTMEIGRLLRLAKIRPILVTFTPNRNAYAINPDAATDGNRVAFWNAVNNATLANAAKYGFLGVVNLKNDINLGGQDAPLNPTYFRSQDALHFTEAGQARIAALAVPVVEAVAGLLVTDNFSDPGQYADPYGLPQPNELVLYPWQPGTGATLVPNGFTKTGGNDGAFDVGLTGNLAAGQTSTAQRAILELTLSSNQGVIGVHAGADSGGDFSQMLANGGFAFQTTDAGIRWHYNGLQDSGNPFTAYQNGDKYAAVFTKTNTIIQKNGQPVATIPYVLPDNSRVDSAIPFVGMGAYDVRFSAANPVLV